MYNELYYLLINTKTAINKFGLSYEELAAILGVSADSVSRWLNNRQEPTELNKYKLHWFVYLALNMDVSYFSLVNIYNIDELTLDTCPLGNYHYAPWNNVDTIVSRYFIKEDSHDQPDDEVPFKDTSAPPKNNCPECDSCYTDEEFFQIMVEEHDDVYLEDYYEIETCFDTVFDLNECTYQESIRRIEFLKKMCDTFVDITNDTLFDHKDSILNDYVRVHDFSSFFKFLKDFHAFSIFDERFDPEYDCFKIVLSKYSDPVMKSINRVIVKDIEAFGNKITLICENGSKYTFINDDRFKINNTSSTSSHDFNFMIRVDKNYYALSYEYTDKH